MVQWLRLHGANAGGLGSIPGQGTRSHMLQRRVHLPQLKIVDAVSRPGTVKLKIKKTIASLNGKKLHITKKSESRNMGSCGEKGLFYVERSVRAY